MKCHFNLQMISSRVSSLPSLSPSSSLSALQPLALNLNDIECFRYRVEDIMKSVTRKTVGETRVSEIQREILHSKKLKDYFRENPEEAEVLKKAFRSTSVREINSYSC